MGFPRLLIRPTLMTAVEIAANFWRPCLFGRQGGQHLRPLYPRPLPIVGEISLGRRLLDRRSRLTGDRLIVLEFGCSLRETKGEIEMVPYGPVQGAGRNPKLQGWPVGKPGIRGADHVLWRGCCGGFLGRPPGLNSADPRSAPCRELKLGSLGLHTQDTPRPPVGRILLNPHC